MASSLLALILPGATAGPALDLMAVEQTEIRGAVRTDFIIPAEIIAITLGTVQASPFLTQVFVLSGVAIIMTIGVYGLVGAIVNLDDAGLYLSYRQGGGKAAYRSRDSKNGAVVDEVLVGRRNCRHVSGRRRNSHAWLHLPAPRHPGHSRCCR